MPLTTPPKKSRPRPQSAQEQQDEELESTALALKLLPKEMLPPALRRFKKEPPDKR